MLEYIFIAVAFIGFMVTGYGALQSTKLHVNDN